MSITVRSGERVRRGSSEPFLRHSAYTAHSEVESRVPERGGSTSIDHLAATSFVLSIPALSISIYEHIDSGYQSK